MNWAAFIVTYAVAWWMILFMVLPFGIGSKQAATGSGYGAAPERPAIKKKLWITTAITIPVSLVAYWLLNSDILSGLVR